RFGLRQADTGNLRIAVGTARNLRLVERLDLQALDHLDRRHALMLGLVRQHGRAGDIADGIDALDVGAAVTIGNDDAPVGFYANGFEADILDIADDADSGNHLLGC